MTTRLVTYDVYMALLGIEGSLISVVIDTLGLDAESGATFVRLWRAKQMERAAISNSLGNARTSFRDCTALSLDYCLYRYSLTPSQDTREALVLAWDRLYPWPEANAAIASGMTCIWSNRHGDRILDPTYPPTHEIPDLGGVAAPING